MSVGSTCRNGATFASVTARGLAAEGVTSAGAARPSSQGCAVGAGLGLEELGRGVLDPGPGLVVWMLAEAAAGQLAATASAAARAPSAGSRRARRIERG
jgi:hypothetical protein